MYIGGKWLCNRYKKQRRDVSDGIPTLVKVRTAVDVLQK